MIGYRLHFEPANLNAIKIVRSGQLGKPRIFNSTFTMQVEAGNIRLQKKLGGGSLYDIGIYCINAARYLFQAEPIAAQALRVGQRGRFKEVEEAISAILHFPDERVAAFTCSFGTAKTSAYEIIGGKGHLRVDPAYEYADSLAHSLTLNQRTRHRRFAKHDQFAPELLYFSDCILNDRKPEPSGLEGLIDVRIINALYRAAETGKRVDLVPIQRRQRPDRRQEIRRPAVKKPALVHASPPSGAR